MKKSTADSTHPSTVYSRFTKTSLDTDFSLLSLDLSLGYFLSATEEDTVSAATIHNNPAHTQKTGHAQALPDTLVQSPVSLLQSLAYFQVCKQFKQARILEKSAASPFRSLPLTVNGL